MVGDLSQSLENQRMKSKIDIYYFLRRFELLAIDHGLRLCMTRAPLGCGLFFYFIDDQTKDKSETYCFHWNRDSCEHLFENLERRAKDFERRES